MFQEKGLCTGLYKSLSLAYLKLCPRAIITKCWQATMVLLADYDK